ncbi:protein IQ-DOMAIN 9-like [Silene latifolia]|uniref:protein IQ-DOMAIN 9-like n=1 Tax=Silene latifolia TaxID=37657 RepID=UPI003D786C52
MGSGNWFKKIISKKKVKVDKSSLTKGSNKTSGSKSKDLNVEDNGNGKVSSKSNGALPKLNEDVAATRIQTAIRAYMARKTVRRMKGTIRFQKLTELKSVKKQCTSTLAHLHSWSRIQSEIRNRRLSMVIEGRRTQKKLDSQLKLEAKLHDLEVEWNSGADTMEEILARIHQKEEAAVKRERAMAYAFNHQWRANCNQNQGPYASELGKANWGWSWKERWIAARPWENRLPSPSISPKKVQNKPTIKAGKNSYLLSTQKSVPSKSAMLNLKATEKGRRLSYPGAEKPVLKKSDTPTKLQEATVEKTKLVS